MSERWLPVVGYEGLYEVSDKGRVWSLKTERLMSQSLAGSSGKRYKVTLSNNGVVQYCYVHTLVLEAFVGPRPSGMVACHRDDTASNALSNLRWDTVSANNHDQVRNGNHANANKTHCRKNGHPLTGDNVYTMRNGGRRCRACKHEDDVRRRETTC